MKVQLGFAEELPLFNDENDDVPIELGHSSPNWMDWDGGKIGGVPSWLNPRDLPQTPIYCLDCSETKKTKMKFVTQLYCPLDSSDNDDNNQAFHRSMYVFACPNVCHSKVEKSKSDKNCGGIRVLRCQLPRSNPFYPYDDNADDDSDFDSKRITSVTHLSTDGWDIPLCRVCGQRGKGNCPKQKLWFCGKECQKEHFKFVFHQQQNNDTKSDHTNNNVNDSTMVCVPSRFNELELVVEEEPPPLSASKTATESSSTDTKSQKKLLKQIQKEAWFNDDNDDESLEQSDLNEMTGGIPIGGGTSDKRTLAFFHRIDRINVDTNKSVKDQCLRYQRWEFEKDSNDDDDDGDDGEEDKVGESNVVEGPLWISAEHIPPSNDDIPKCPYCQGDRKFEFQIMPQMLNYLSSSYNPTNASNDAKKNDSTTNDKHAASITNDQNLQSKTKKSSLSIPESAKQAILAISDIREREGDENIQQEYIDKHDEALAKVKDDLLGNTSFNDNSGGTNQRDVLDFGVIAVFTCVNSCGAFINGDGDGMNNGNSELGAYREEFAWRQPPLD